MTEQSTMLPEVQMSSALWLGFDPKRFVDMQKVALDLYARQTTAAIDSMRLFFPFVPSGLYDSSQECITKLFRIQMQTLDEIVNRSRGYPHGESMTDLLRHSAESMLAVHNQLVDCFVQLLHRFGEAANRRLNT